MIFHFQSLTKMGRWVITVYSLKILYHCKLLKRTKSILYSRLTLIFSLESRVRYCIFTADFYLIFQIQYFAFMNNIVNSFSILNFVRIECLHNSLIMWSFASVTVYKITNHFHTDNWFNLHLYIIKLNTQWYYC